MRAMQIRRRPPNPPVRVAQLTFTTKHPEAEPRHILERIVWKKGEEIDQARRQTPLEELQTQALQQPPCRGFRAALAESPEAPAVIAEVKKASPSKGVIREDFDPAAIASAYAAGGASCLSVLTDQAFFQGGFHVLATVREAVTLPLLCKDFVISAYQIYQARLAGADAVLLIAAILSNQDLAYLLRIAVNLGLDCLVEVHNGEEMERVLGVAGINLVGINNRDLTTFATDLSTTDMLLQRHGQQLAQRQALVVSESGLFNRSHLDRVVAAGAHAVLVGEALMRQQDVAAALLALRGVNPPPSAG